MAAMVRSEVVRWLGVGLAAVTALLLLWPAPDEVPVRTLVRFEPGQEPDPRMGLFDLSPDGSLLVYRREGVGGGGQLWVLRLDSGETRPIPGTRGAGLPAVSPDATEVAFATEGRPGHILVAPIAGGASRTVADSAAPGGVRWSPDGRWIFYSTSGWGLARAPAEGGPPEILTRHDGEQHWGVDVLPGGRAVLFTASVSDGGDPRIEVLDLESGQVDDLWSGSFARYSPGRGLLVFMDLVEPSLRTVSFDVGRLRLEGEPVTAETGVSRRGRWPLFAVSRDAVVYGTPVGGVDVTPVWVERDGSSRPVRPGWRFRGLPIYSSLALAPDDGRLAYSSPDDDGAWHVWIAELAGGAGGATPTRLTDEGRLNYRPTWAGDGRSLTFISDRAGQADLWEAEAAPDVSARRILDRQTVVRNGFRSPDGAWLVFREGEAPVADIFGLPVVAAPDARRSGIGGAPRDSVTVPLVTTTAGERSPTLSPDGRWLAYTSQAGGRWDVWVTGFPEPRGGPWLVSPGGGEEPVWSNAGGELFFRSLADELVSVPIHGSRAVPPGAPTVLFPTVGFLGSDGRAQYDVSADDRRFLMLRVEEGGDVRLTRVERFGSGLRPRR